MSCLLVDMNEEKLWPLIVLKLSGEASQQELAELQNLTLEFPELAVQIALLEEFWRTKQNNANTNIVEKAFDKHLQRLSNHNAQPALQYEETMGSIQNEVPVISSFRNKIIWIGSIAASLILAVTVYIVATKEHSLYPSANNIVSTKPASKSKIILPDGSQVWLNSESKISYGKQFGSTLREVELTGEAFFDVVKDKNKPFIIHTSTIDIRVIGTAFNVRSYPGEKTVETALIRGIVEVTVHNNPENKIILKPNEKLVLQVPAKNDKSVDRSTASDNNEPFLSISKLQYLNNDSSAVETSWTKNQLAFSSESLDEVAAKIGRWYGVEIMIKDQKLIEGKYTGVFEDESLTEVLNALKLTGNFRYVINKKQITITE